jgi:hypothetical protein
VLVWLGTFSGYIYNVARCNLRRMCLLNCSSFNKAVMESMVMGRKLPRRCLEELRKTTKNFGLYCQVPRLRLDPMSIRIKCQKFHSAGQLGSGNTSLGRSCRVL